VPLNVYDERRLLLCISPWSFFVLHGLFLALISLFFFLICVHFSLCVLAPFVLGSVRFLLSLFYALRIGFGHPLGFAGSSFCMYDSNRLYFFLSVLPYCALACLSLPRPVLSCPVRVRPSGPSCPSVLSVRSVRTDRPPVPSDRPVVTVIGRLVLYA